MNIIDAIKSGRLHKRKSKREWCHSISATNLKIRGLRMRVLLSAKNAMGLVANYEVDVDSLLDFQRAVLKLYSLPGIVHVTMPEETTRIVKEWSDQWEGFDNT